MSSSGGGGGSHSRGRLAFTVHGNTYHTVLVCTWTARGKACTVPSVPAPAVWRLTAGVCLGGRVSNVLGISHQETNKLVIIYKVMGVTLSIWQTGVWLWFRILRDLEGVLGWLQQVVIALFWTWLASVMVLVESITGCGHKELRNQLLLHRLGTLPFGTQSRVLMAAVAGQAAACFLKISQCMLSHYVDNGFCLNCLMYFADQEIRHHTNVL